MNTIPERSTKRKNLLSFACLFIFYAWLFMFCACLFTFFLGANHKVLILQVTFCGGFVANGVV